MAAASGIRLGADCKTYYRSAGSWGTPTYTEITNIRDLDYGMDDKEDDATTRGSGKVEMSVLTLRSYAPTWTMIENYSDTVFVALMAAYVARTVTEFLFVGGTRTDTGNNYVRFEAQIRAKKTEPIDGKAAWEFTVKPYPGDNTPVQGLTA